MREMKDSGIEWIGAIPQDWKTDRLQWHLKEINVSNNPIQTKNILSLTIEAGVIPYAEKGNQGNKAKEDYSQYKIALPDTLVINSMNVIIGAVGISQYFGCVSPVYYVFEPIEGTDLRYIYYLFTNTGFQKEMRKYAKGILEIRLRISSNDMLKRIVPSPPFKEQQRIADYLDKMCAEIDTVLEKTRASIEEYKKLKQAVITQAVTKGIRGDRPMKDSGIEWIGEIPEGWSKNKVIRLFDIIGSGTTPKNITSDFPVVNWIQSGDITGSFMPTCKNVISANLLSQYSALKVYPAPFIIIAMYGASVGNASISLIDGCVNQACCVLSSPSCNLHYAFYVIKSAQSYLVRKAVGGGQPNISQETIKQLWLPLPPLSTQDIIVRNLDATCSKIDDLLSSVHASIEEYKKLKQAVITLAVTKGVRGEREMKDSGVEWIGEIPAE